MWLKAWGDGLWPWGVGVETELISVVRIVSARRLTTRRRSNDGPSRTHFCPVTTHFCARTIGWQIVLATIVVLSPDRYGMRAVPHPRRPPSWRNDPGARRFRLRIDHADGGTIRVRNSSSCGTRQVAGRVSRMADHRVTTPSPWLIAPDATLACRRRVSRDQGRVSRVARCSASRLTRG